MKFQVKKKKKKKILNYRRKLRWIGLVSKDEYFLSFQNFYMQREMEILWKVFDDLFRNAWGNMWTNYEEDTAYTTDFFYYETPFLKKAYEKNKMLGSSVSMDTFSQKEDHSYEQRHVIYDEFYFDNFFFWTLYFIFNIFILFFIFFIFFMFFISFLIWYSFKYCFSWKWNWTIWNFWDWAWFIPYTFTDFSFVEAPSLSKLFFLFQCRWECI